MSTEITKERSSWKRYVEWGLALLVIVLLIALLLPAVQKVRSGVRNTCRARLRHIGLALLNYHDSFRSLPLARSFNETPHSWRVALTPFLVTSVPFLEMPDIYDEYAFDQPWDSPYNSQFAKTAPAIYRCPQDPSSESMTSYIAPVGDTRLGEIQPVFETGQQVKLEDISDGTANTIMIFERHQSGIIWTQPVDASVTQDRLQEGMAGLGFVSIHSKNKELSGCGQAALADGSVRYISNIDPDVLRRLVLRNDGEGDFEF